MIGRIRNSEGDDYFAHWTLWFLTRTGWPLNCELGAIRSVS